MISKERLEELIVQGATIYKKRESVVFDYNLKKGNYVENNKLMYCNPKSYYEVFVGSIEDLFETKEDAEWYRQFGCIERTIKLDLPKWERIDKDNDFHYIRNYQINKNFSFFIEIYKFANVIKISGHYGILKTDKKFDEMWDLSEESYMIACRKAKELFLGEQNG